MPPSLRYDASAVHEQFGTDKVARLEPALTAARDEVWADVHVFNSGQKVPDEKRPLDAGFIEMPDRMLARDQSAGSLLRQIDQAAGRLRDELDRVVLLGIGGSYMGARALFEALCHPFHNELSRGARGNVPRLYFEGNNLDNDVQRSLLELLKEQCSNPDDVAQRWGILVISKSGGTLETAVAFRLFRAALERYYGRDSERSRRFVVPITGEDGKLRNFSNKKGYPAVFPIPEGVGGRYSVLTAVGLLPAAVLGIDVRQLLRGAQDMTDRFRTMPVGENPVLDYVAACHLAERDHAMTIRVLSTWGKRLEALGLWYDQLLSESLGKEQRGATPITAVNTRDLHSRGQQHQEGRRDKLITNVIVESSARPPLELPEVPDDENQDDLNKHAAKTVPQLMEAALQGTNKAYADDARPTADIVLPQLDAYVLGELLQMLMLATVVEGRLIGVNPYGQPGVEAYKANMQAILKGE